MAWASGYLGTAISAQLPASNISIIHIIIAYVVALLSLFGSLNIFIRMFGRLEDERYHIYVYICGDAQIVAKIFLKASCFQRPIGFWLPESSI